VADPEADADVDIGLHLSGDDAKGPLGGEDEVDAERTTESGEVFEQVSGLRMSGHERMEFVDDDDQARWRVVEVENIGASVLGQQPFPVGDLGAYRDEGAEGQTGIEVIEDAVGVRQILQGGEGSPALEIDEHETQPPRRVGQ